jgi:methionyl aminopeptidase
MSYVEATDTSLRKTGQIKLHGPGAFAGMRKAGALVAKCLDELTDIVKAGVPTSDIDEFVREFAFGHGAYPATLMYRGYRYSTCTSINHVVCHGMPGDRLLKEGDIVNIDVTFIVEGWYGDSSRMYAIAPIARKAERLIEVTYEAMMRGIAAVKPGATTGDIGHAIQSFVEPQGMSVVRDFCGHGLGRMFHDEPNIIHIGRPGEGVALKPGMFFTIEPMINLGKPHVKILSDGWTAVTRDRSLSAQFEHSVGVTATGVEIFTLSQRHGEKPPAAAGLLYGRAGRRPHDMSQLSQRRMRWMDGRALSSRIGDPARRNYDAMALTKAGITCFSATPALCEEGNSCA